MIILQMCDCTQANKKKKKTRLKYYKKNIKDASLIFSKFKNTIFSGDNEQFERSNLTILYLAFVLCSC